MPQVRDMNACTPSALREVRCISRNQLDESSYSHFSVQESNMIAFVLLLLASLALADNSVTLAGYDKYNTRDFPSSINTRNIHRLRIKWNATTCNGRSATATPLVMRDRVCVPDFGKCYTCWDRRTGSILLRKSVTTDYGLPIDHISRTTPTYVRAGNRELVVLASNANTSILNPTAGTWIFAVDFHTGALVWKSVVSPNNWTLVTQSPMIEDGYIYVGISSAEAAAPYVTPNAPCCQNTGTFYKFRARDGHLMWSTPVIPDGLRGYGKYSGAGIWGSTPVIVGNRIYVGTGQLSKVPDEAAACILANPKNASCIHSSVHFDSVVGFNKHTGAIEVSFRASPADIWNVACLFGGALPGCQCLGVCDYDYDITTLMYSKSQDTIFASSKSGFVFALTRDLRLLWTDQAVNGSASGGIVWQNALRDARFPGQLGFFIQQANDRRYNYTLPNGTIKNGGAFVRYDARGHVVWMTPTPNNDKAYGPIALSNDLLFGSTRMTGLLLAMDANTGRVLWQYQSSGSVASGCAIVGNDIFWPLGPGNVVNAGIVDQDKIVAFTIDR